MDAGIPIADDVLERAREIADRESRPIGEVVSEWARRGMDSRLTTILSRNGIPVLPRRGSVVTLELVNRLADESDLSLATLDRRLSPAAVTGGAAALHVIA